MTRTQLRQKALAPLQIRNEDIADDAAIDPSKIAGGGTGTPGNLATVATTGSYTDLINKPVLFSGSYADLQNKPTLFSGVYADLTGKPTLFSGSYADLTSKPTFSTVATTGAYSDLIGKPVLATVATSGSYADLVSKPTLSTVATSGSYADLLNKPTIPAPYTLPVATSSVLGGVKQGANVTISTDGTISVAAPGSGGSGPTSTDQLGEGTTNLYYTNQRASAAAPVQSVAGKTGTVTLAIADIGSLTSTLAGKEPSVTSGTTAQYYRGDKTFQTLNADAVPDGTINKAYTAVEKTKLSGIATGATANDTDANLKARANHTGTQAISTISGLQSALDAKQATLTSGTNIKTVNGTSLLGSGDLSVAPDLYIDNDTITGDSSSTVPLKVNVSSATIISAIRTAISATGTGGSYNSSTGVITFSASGGGSTNVVTAADANNGSVNALYIVPNDDQSRVFLGNATKGVFAVNFRYVASLEAVPQFTFSANNLTLGGNSDAAITRRNNVITFNSASSGTGTDNGYRWLGDTTGYNNIDAAATYMVLQRGLLGVGTAASGSTLTPLSKIDVDGSVGVGAISTKTAAYTLTITDNVVLCDATSAAFTVTLPSAATCARREYLVKRISAANNVTLATSASQTIDGAATVVLASNYKYVRVKSDGANWYIIGGN